MSEEIKEENIINENNEIVDFDDLCKITNSGINKCVCKIMTQIESTEKSGKKKSIIGTGFFCNLPFKKKVFITCNHVLDEEFINKEEKLVVFIDKEKKEIDLKQNRFKYTNKELDFSIIEILRKDKIKKYLELDEYIESRDYEEEQIFTFQFPEGKNLSYSHGKIIKKKDNYFQYSLGTKGGSSGSPIILIENLKVIGLHKGKCKDEDIIKFCLGIPINLIIENMNSIQSACKTIKEHIGKEIIMVNKKLDEKKNLDNSNKNKKYINNNNNNLKIINLKVLLLGRWREGLNKVVSLLNKMYSSEGQHLEPLIEAIEYLDSGQCINFDIWFPMCSESVIKNLKMGYKGADAIIFFFNACHLFSFEEIKDLFNHKREYSPGTPILIVYDYKTEFIEREEVFKKEAEEFAEKIGAIFFYSYELNESDIHHLFCNIGRKYLEEEEKKKKEKQGELLEKKKKKGKMCFII